MPIKVPNLNKAFGFFPTQGDPQLEVIYASFLYANKLLFQMQVKEKGTMLSISVGHYFILIEDLSFLSMPLSNDIKTCELKLDPTWLVLKSVEAESWPTASSHLYNEGSQEKEAVEAPGWLSE